MAQITIRSIARQDGGVHVGFSDGSGLFFADLATLRSEIKAHRIAPIHLLCEAIDAYLATDPDLKDLATLRAALLGKTLSTSLTTAVAV